MLLILSSEVPPLYNLIFSTFLPFTLKRVAISPYCLPLTLVSLPQISFLSPSGSDFWIFVLTATSLSLGLNAAYLPSAGYWCPVGSYLCGQLVQHFPWCPDSLLRCYSPAPPPNYLRLILWDQTASPPACALLPLFSVWQNDFFLESLESFWHSLLSWSFSLSKSSYSSSFSSPTYWNPPSLSDFSTLLLS